MTTWNIWMESSIKTYKGMSNGQPTFYDRDDFIRALKHAEDRARRFCNVRFQVVNSGYHFRFYSRNPDTARFMYLGNGGHAAGLHFLDTNQIYYHDGWVPAWSHPNRKAFWWRVVSGLESLAGLILHELGHDESLLGLPHTWDMGSVMGDPPQYLKDLLRRRFGAPVFGHAPRLTHLRTERVDADTVKWHYNQSEDAYIRFYKNGSNTFSKFKYAGDHYIRFSLPAPTVDCALTAESYNGTDRITTTISDAPRANWQNPNNRYDVSGDGHTSPIDALRIINKLNRDGAGPVPPLPEEPPPYYDVNGDGQITPVDSLQVINHLNRMRAHEFDPIESDLLQLLNIASPYLHRRVSTTVAYPNI